MDAGQGTCDSCGRAGETVMAVHRVYVTPEAWDTPGKVEMLDEIERWCFACRTHYPHEAVETAEPVDPADGGDPPA